MPPLYVKIEGMHCEHCERKLRNVLLQLAEIDSVDFDGHIAEISYHGHLDTETLIALVAEAGYQTRTALIANDKSYLRPRARFFSVLVILAVVMIVSFLLEAFLGFNPVTLIPRLDNSMTYGALFVTGLLTSFHCVAMCGALNLGAIYNSGDQKSWWRPLLYNAGRVGTYTLIGAVAGGLGQVISLGNTPGGILMILVAGVMVWFSLAMLGWVPFPPAPAFLSGQKLRGQPLLVGILNGFMPCGPLQAMQLYALGTGSVVQGALSMLCFGLGTLPLMLGVGVFYSALNGRVRQKINLLAATLVLFLALLMAWRGCLKLGLDFGDKTERLSPTSSALSYSGYLPATLAGDTQTVSFDLSYSHYADLVLQVGVPATITINATADTLTGCNQRVVFPDFGIEQTLQPGANKIEFTPTHTGTFTYTCSMQMISNRLKVVDDRDFFAGRSK